MHCSWMALRSCRNQLFDVAIETGGRSMKRGLLFFSFVLLMISAGAWYRLRACPRFFTRNPPPAPSRRAAITASSAACMKTGLRSKCNNRRKKGVEEKGRSRKRVGGRFRRKKGVGAGGKAQQVGKQNAISRKGRRNWGKGGVMGSERQGRKEGKNRG